MRCIQLANNKGIALVDGKDYLWLSKLPWFFLPFRSMHKGGYAATKIKGKRVYMHRLILDLDLKKDKTKICDHINRNGLDNRRENLRIVNYKENSLNKSKTIKLCSSKFKGVVFHKRKNKWQSTFCGKYLGSFETEKLALNAYIIAGGVQ